jgi:hypothetical protein
VFGGHDKRCGALLRGPCKMLQVRSPR